MIFTLASYWHARFEILRGQVIAVQDLTNAELLINQIYFFFCFPFLFVLFFVFFSFFEEGVLFFSCFVLVLHVVLWRGEHWKVSYEKM